MENSRSRDATASVSAVLNPTTRFALVWWIDRPVSGLGGRRPPFLKIRNRKSEIEKKKSLRNPGSRPTRRQIVG
jgi:hypothetical protein